MESFIGKAFLFQASMFVLLPSVPFVGIASGGARGHQSKNSTIACALYWPCSECRLVTILPILVHQHLLSAGFVGSVHQFGYCSSYVVVRSHVIAIFWNHVLEKRQKQSVTVHYYFGQTYTVSGWNSSSLESKTSATSSSCIAN